MNKNRPIWQRLLFRILKEHGAFKEFERETIKYRGTSLNEYLNTVNRGLAISSAFVWDMSILGGKFWSDIHVEYSYKLSSLIKNKHLEEHFDTLFDNASV